MKQSDGMDEPEITASDGCEAVPASSHGINRERSWRVLARLDGRHWLMASLLYGSGFWLMECIPVRVKDVDFLRAGIVVRDSKGTKDRFRIGYDRS